MSKQYKLKFKPTPISRLSKYTVPIPMVGDPKWNRNTSTKDAWASREKFVYQHMIANKTRYVVNGEYAEILSQVETHDWLQDA